jgi:hypothetical protein
LILLWPRPMPTKLPAEARSTPVIPGRGFLCAIVTAPGPTARAALKILLMLPKHNTASRSRRQNAPAEWRPYERP